MTDRLWILIGAMALIWTVLTFWVPPYILPSLWSIARALYVHCNLIAWHLLITFTTMLIGFVSGAIVGTFMGMVVFMSPTVRGYIMPLAFFKQALPNLLIAPLLLLWFGYGIGTKCLICFLVVYFPMLVQTYDALERVRGKWQGVLPTLPPATTWRARRLRLKYLYYPDIKLTITQSLIFSFSLTPAGALAGEWVGSQGGIGYVMMNASAQMEIPLLFATALVFALMSVYGVKGLRYVVS